MFEALVRFLIAVCVLAIAVFLVIWVFGVLGIMLPAHIIQIIWVIVVLVCILLLYRFLRPYVGGWFP